MYLLGNLPFSLFMVIFRWTKLFNEHRLDKSVYGQKKEDQLNLRAPTKHFTGRSSVELRQAHTPSVNIYIPRVTLTLEDKPVLCVTYP